MVIKPRNPVRRPMGDSWSCNLLEHGWSFLRSFAGNNPMDQGPLHGSRLFRDAVGLLQQGSRISESCVRVVMNGAKGLPGANRVTNFFLQDQADGRIDEILLFFAATAEHEAGYADLLALNAGDEAARWARERRLVLRLGQALRIVNHARVTALLRHDLAKFLEC